MKDKAPLVLVTVGTEHYPFHRLVRWIDTWLDTDRGRRVQCVVQYGFAASPTHGEGHPFLTFQEMESEMRRAGAVVSHGGTGSVMLSRRLGLKPIVVPRTKALGEHVDDHQVLFARRLAALGDIEIAETEERLSGLLDDFVDGRLDPRTATQADDTEQAVRRFGELVQQLFADSRGEAL